VLEDRRRDHAVVTVAEQQLPRVAQLVAEEERHRGRPGHGDDEHDECVVQGAGVAGLRPCGRSFERAAHGGEAGLHAIPAAQSLRYPTAAPAVPEALTTRTTSGRPHASRGQSERFARRVVRRCMTEFQTIVPAGVTGTAHRIRAFFALVPDEATRLEFVALAREVARRSRGRAITGDHVHLTVAFLGDVETSALPRLRAIGDALPLMGAELDFDVLGAWRASGVAWVAPAEVPLPLTAMCVALHDALQQEGFSLDTRPFRPHVTLARRCVAPQPRAHCAPIRWNVSRLCLIGSELRPEGPLYTQLHEWALRPSR